MSNKNEGKWLPYNLDGCVHDCKPSDMKSTDAQNHKSVIRIKGPLQWRKGLQDWKRQFLEILSKRNKINILMYGLSHVREVDAIIDWTTRKCNVFSSSHNKSF